MKAKSRSFSANIRFILKALSMLIMFVPVPTIAGTTTIAVASNFAKPMTELAQVFESESGHSTKLSFGSSGKILAQVVNGAPFDVFLSADQHKPSAIEKRGLSVPGTQFTYAVGKLALWSNKPTFIDDNSDRLTSGSFNKLAIANPKLAPYGAAAEDVLENLGLKKTLKRQWVTGENVTQTYQFVSSGNADLGFVSVSQVFQNGQLAKGSAWLVPSNLYQPIKQDAILLMHGKNNNAAIAFIKFLASDRAQQVIESYGYSVDPH